MEAVFKHGEPLMCKYTPAAADVAVGAVVVVGDAPCICHTAIATGKLGALAVVGGVYTMTGDGQLAAGENVYWDDTNNKVSKTAVGAKHFGRVAPGSSCAADTKPVDVVHAPNGTAKAGG